MLLNNWVYLLVVAISVVSAYGCLSVLRRQRLFDIPNARSSHSVPTPRGGGISFALVYLGVIIALFLSGSMALAEVLPLAVGGAVLALVGLLDDRFGLSSGSRLMVQIICVAVTVISFYFYQLADSTAGLWLWLGLLIVAAVWWVNLFNFLDGIDGYAVSEAICVCIAAAGLCLQVEAALQGQMFLLLAMSLVGFGIVNWAPAKLFMGDVGSYFLGFMIAMLAVLTVRDQLISPLTWLILTALFWIDASYTLMRRVVQGKSWYQAHRSHAYQILSRRWKSHQSVSILATGINVFWLIPLSFVSQWLLLNQQLLIASVAVVVACGPLLWGVHSVKSGLDES